MIKPLDKINLIY